MVMTFMAQSLGTAVKSVGEFLSVVIHAPNYLPLNAVIGQLPS